MPIELDQGHGLRWLRELAHNIINLASTFACKFRFAKVHAGKCRDEVFNRRAADSRVIGRPAVATH